jgi:glucose-6-phosphate dehydrogenase assembly protein OpcA
MLDRGEESLLVGCESLVFLGWFANCCLEWDVDYAFSSFALSFGTSDWPSFPGGCHGSTVHFCGTGINNLDSPELSATARTLRR